MGGGAAVPRRDNLVSRDTLLKHSVFPDQGQISCRSCRLKAAEELVSNAPNPRHSKAKFFSSVTSSS